MLAMALGTVLLGAAQGATLWLDAREVNTEAMSIEMVGEFRAWAWLPAGEDAVLYVGGDSLSFRGTKAGKGRDDVWVRGGKIALDGRSPALRCEGNPYAFLLSTQDGFDPRAVIGDRRVYDTPRAVADRRATTARHTDTVYTMPHFETRAEWEAYAATLRRRILLSSGLVPLPDRTPLKARVFDERSFEGYTVAKVHFEARPGFLVTGNLYRPLGDGPFPAVVSPHGHWEKGRLEDIERGSVPARCITLARMGIVTFSYDMIGYNDSMQCEHRWGGGREKLWGLHPFAMQLWSSIRAVDFVEDLPGVDPDRIGCTGASGGGTQTFALVAVDPRVKVAAPVNMISSTMQGGCLCENAPILRLDNSNMEIGALMAPRPMIMVSARGDWTRETQRVEFPAIRSIYELYGAADRLEHVHVDAEHNYNLESREAVYRFFGKWLLGRDDFKDYTEPPYEKPADEMLRVFPDKEALKDYRKQKAVITATINENRAKWDVILQEAQSDRAAFRAEYGDVLGAVTGASTPHANDLGSERISMEERDGYVVERWIIGRPAVGDAIPALFYRSTNPAPAAATLMVHGSGKAALADPETGGVGPVVRLLLAEGRAVLCIDAFLIGEHHPPHGRTQRLRQGGFMDTFQPTDTGYRIQDVLTAMAFLRARRDLSGHVSAIGIEDGGLWTLLAAAIDGGVEKVFVDSSRLPANDAAWTDDFYVPCLRAVGDIRTAVALLDPQSLVVMEEGADMKEIEGVL